MYQLSFHLILFCLSPTNIINKKINSFRGDTYMTSSLRGVWWEGYKRGRRGGGGGVAKAKLDVIGCRGWW